MVVQICSKIIYFIIILTLGPAGPEAPAGPGSPEGPYWQEKKKWKLLFFSSCGYYIQDLNCMFHKLNRVTYRWSWGSLHSSKSSVSLHASLTSLASLTLVSTSSSGSLNKDITPQTTVLCIPQTELHAESGLEILLWFESLTQDLQRVHGDQQGQQHRQDQKGPRKEKKWFVSFTTNNYKTNLLPYFLSHNQFNSFLEMGHLQTLHDHQSFQQGQWVQEHQEVQEHRECQQSQSHHGHPMSWAEVQNFLRDTSTVTQTNVG